MTKYVTINSIFTGAVLGAYISFGVSPIHLITASVMSAPAALACAKLLMPGKYSPVLKERQGSLFGTFQAGCIGLYWAGNVGVKVPNDRHGSLFKHQRVNTFRTGQSYLLDDK